MEPRIIYMGNNLLGLKILKWLKKENANIVGAIVHDESKQNLADEIIMTSQLDSAAIFYGNQLAQPSVLEKINKLKPDLGLSILFGYIFKEDFINIFRDGIINLHSSFLPFNKGAHPNVWSILEETPAGATLHFIDKGVDTGDIISQEKLPVEPTDTGSTLYEKLDRLGFKLFVKTWPKIKANKISRTAQEINAGTFHLRGDLEKTGKIELDKCYKAKELINLLRARTYVPFPGAYFEQDGKKIFMRLQLTYEDGLGNDKIK